MQEETKISKDELMVTLEKLKTDKVLLNENFQKKLIKLIVEDEKFAEEIMDMLHVEYFDGLHSKMLMKHLMAYVEKYNLIPDYDTINDFLHEKEPEGLTRERLLEFVALIKEYKITDKQQVKDISLEFCKKQSLRKAILAASDEWEKENYDDISRIINDALKLGEPKSNGHDYFADVDKRLIKQFRNPVPFLRGLDSFIGGGLAGGELGVILAATGVGKSMMLVKGACNALLHGKKVIYYSFELSESVIGNRFDSCLSQIELKNIFDFPDAVKEVVADVQARGGQLKIKEYPTGSASINTIKSHLKSLEREGFVPDVIFIDYADIMKPVGSIQEMRFALKSIYEALRGLAMEMKIPVWTASQANRDAVNEAKVGMKAIGESLGKGQTADVVIGIGRSEEDKQALRATMNLIKNRNGIDGNTIDLHFDTSKIDIRVLETEIDHKMGLKGLGLEAQIRGQIQNPNP